MARRLRLGRLTWWLRLCLSDMQLALAEVPGMDVWRAAFDHRLAPFGRTMRPGLSMTGLETGRGHGGGLTS